VGDPLPHGRGSPLPLPVGPFSLLASLLSGQARQPQGRSSSPSWRSLVAHPPLSSPQLATAAALPPHPHPIARSPPSVVVGDVVASSPPPPPR
jgi:hypothetical protein